MEVITMQYQIEDHRIVASDGQQFVGEISFPAVQGYSDRVVAERVFVHPDFRGQGVAVSLVKRFIDYVTDQGWTVKLMCPFVTQQFKQHPEYQHLLLPEDRF